MRALFSVYLTLKNIFLSIVENDYIIQKIYIIVQLIESIPTQKNCIIFIWNIWNIWKSYFKADHSAIFSFNHYLRAMYIVYIVNYHL